MNELRKKIYDIIDLGTDCDYLCDIHIEDMTDQIMNLIESHDTTKGIDDLPDQSDGTVWNYKGTQSK